MRHNKTENINRIDKLLIRRSSATRFALALAALAIICTHAAAQESTSDDWYRKGLELQRNDKRQDAIEAFDRAVELNSSNSLAWHGKASNLFMMGRYEEANQAYDKALETESDEYFSAVLWIKKGDALENLKRHEQAASAYQQGVDIADAMISRYENISDSENLSAAWLLKGELLEQIKRFEEAIEAYDKVTKIDPENVIAWNNIALIQGTELSRFNESLHAWEKILEIDPTHREALSGKAKIYDATGRHEEATKVYNNYIEVFKTDDIPEDQKSIRLRKEGFRAQVLFILGRYNESLELCDKIFNSGRRAYGTIFYRGKSLDALGRRQEAVEAYEEALKDFHLIEETRMRDAGPFIFKGNILRALGRHEEALAAYDEALRQNPRYIGAWHSRGLALRDLGRDDEAEEAFARSREMGYVG